MKVSVRDGKVSTKQGRERGWRWVGREQAEIRDEPTSSPVSLGSLENSNEGGLNKDRNRSGKRILKPKA